VSAFITPTQPSSSYADVSFPLLVRPCSNVPSILATVAVILIALAGGCGPESLACGEIRGGKSGEEKGVAELLHNEPRIRHIYERQIVLLQLVSPMHAEDSDDATYLYATDGSWQA
jgi:hypothetical protein